MRGSSCSVILMGTQARTRSLHPLNPYVGLALAMPLNFSTLSAFYGPSALLIFGVARWTGTSLCDCVSALSCHLCIVRGTQTMQTRFSDHGGAGFWGKSNFGRGIMASFDERAAWSTLVSKTASTNFTPEAAGMGSSECASSCCPPLLLHTTFCPYSHVQVKVSHLFRCAVPS